MGVNMKSCAVLLLLITLPYLMGMASAAQCGRQAGGRRCSGGLCCSQYGWCGTTPEYCGRGQCQSQCSMDVPDEDQAQARAFAESQAQAQAYQAQQGRPFVVGNNAGAP